MFSRWQIGLDIQRESVRAVAVCQHRQGWQLRHWWHLPLSNQSLSDQIFPSSEILQDVLSRWRRHLPYRYKLRIGFPTPLTLQHRIPSIDENVSMLGQERYISHILAQQQFGGDNFCFDYTVQDDFFHVTSAKQEDINKFLLVLKTVQLFPSEITPCDKVLHILMAKKQIQDADFLIHEEREHWLWAKLDDIYVSGWIDKREIKTFESLCEYLKTSVKHIAFSRAVDDEDIPQNVTLFNPWHMLSRVHPPLPTVLGAYTVATGLALGISPQ